MKVSEVMTRDVQTVRPDQTGAGGGQLHAAAPMPARSRLPRATA